MIHPLLVNHIEYHSPISLCYPTFISPKLHILVSLIFSPFILNHNDGSRVHLARLDWKLKFEAQIKQIALRGNLVLGFAISATELSPVLGAMEGTQIILAFIEIFVILKATCVQRMVFMDYVDSASLPFVFNVHIIFFFDASQNHVTTSNVIVVKVRNSYTRAIRNLTIMIKGRESSSGSTFARIGLVERVF